MVYEADVLDIGSRESEVLKGKETSSGVLAFPDMVAEQLLLQDQADAEGQQTYRLLTKIEFNRK